MSLETPILFCIYKRADLTSQVFDVIAEQKPKHLLVVQDGPRFDDEMESIEQTRNVLERIDWDCDVQTNFSATNMGCKDRIASGISWGFQQHERLIILEDDCLLDPSFFTFSEELLEKYADCEDVHMIGACNFQNRSVTDKSYYFCKYAHIWGWASWRRAWNHYDVDIKDWPTLKANQTFRKWCCTDQEYEYWSRMFDLLHEGKMDTWDFQWMYSCWKQGGLTIQPSVNLVSNLGFREDATHTTAESNFAKMPTQKIGRLDHPESIELNDEADQYTWETMFRPHYHPAPKPKQKRWKRFLQSFRKSA